MKNNSQDQLSETSSEKESPMAKKTYQKPKIVSEKILEAGLGSTCNGTTAGSRKATTPTCKTGSLKT